MDDFTRQYLITALWSTTDEADESGGEPLDENFDVDDLDPRHGGAGAIRLRPISHAGG